jgi:ATP-dependent RNA helicase SUPV3L1/SUV3
LLALSTAEDITGIARGVAFQLTEALGVLERHRVAEEVKGLEQEARAALRKYGVRFGAYHLYLPNLLKPGPRALAVQLWALKEATPDTKGLDDVPHLAASGRTSFPADKDVPKALYRVVGYRVCGERAVRVDILERLADLIRPALAWRAGSPQPKPPGANEGGGFTVTVNMTSLTGTSGEDFASVLRSLGYRMEKRPKPAEPTPAPVEAPSAEPAATEAAATAATEATPTETPLEAAIAPIAEAPPEPTAAPVVPSAAIEAAPETPMATAVAPVVPEAAAEAAAPEQPAEAAAEAKPAEPEMIEVWRPGRPPEERRPRPPRREGERREQGPRRDRRPRSQVAAQDGAPAAAPAEAPAAAQAEQAKPERPDQRQRQGRDRPDREREREGRPQARERRGGERPERDRSERGDRPRREGRRDFKDRDRGEAREWIDPKERRGQADPNSPFAKLAALKEQLEKR